MAHPHSSPHTGHELPASPSSAEQATLIGTLAHLWPYIWPSDRSDLKMRVVWSFVLLLIAKLATLAVPFTFKWATDALTGKGSAPVWASDWMVWVDRLASDHDRQLWRRAGRDGGADAVARRHLRAGGDACGAQARLHHLRPHARIVAALPSGAQDRRVDARSRARPQRHRDHRAHGDPAADPDHRRGHAADGRAALGVRLALRARHALDGRGLSCSTPTRPPNGGSASAAT